MKNICTFIPTPHRETHENIHEKRFPNQFSLQYTLLEDAKERIERIECNNEMLCE